MEKHALATVDRQTRTKRFEEAQAPSRTGDLKMWPVCVNPPIEGADARETNGTL